MVTFSVLYDACVLYTVRLRLKKPAIEAVDYILLLERQGLVKTASMLRTAKNLL